MLKPDILEKKLPRSGQVIVYFKSMKQKGSMKLCYSTVLSPLQLLETL